MLSQLQSLFSTGGDEEPSHPHIKPGKPVKTSYVSLPVDIHPNFLSLTPDPDLVPDARPIAFNPVDWTKTPIPEYAGKLAFILEHVLSPSECAQLIKCAEESVPLDNPTARSKDGGPWGPALVNVGNGFEILEPSYRRSDRIIWDTKEIADKIWARCLTIPELRQEIEVIQGKDKIKKVTGRDEWRGDNGSGVWVMQRMNERLRFLRYEKGGFFQPHCDSSFYLTSEKDKVIRTLFTVHIYLNDCKATAEDPESTELVGGATTMFSSDERRRYDVECKAGRVLVFQHSGLLHSGDEVKQGVKFTVRSDVLYEQIMAEDGKEGEGSK
ncbi:hypothetical protein QBC40DRAFT_83094 [Triangularia verruculosa]|uniref:Prolyl 4-hydroxylase alpha subunit domain-containing protein n=1 Tax=Triangularia verruculosa TaxID=2587418 RepID=A0AAN7AU97_9PEZI|nr:hypothetical protein QBC40DRAFT_83094 [Triangularia verruculosa]